MYWVAPLAVRAAAAPDLWSLDAPGDGAGSSSSSATWFWHAPPIYDLALRSSGWHYLEHVCFLGTGLLFWYPVVRPYPSQAALVALAAAPVPDPGRPAEHAPVGPADLRRPPALSLLRGGAAPGGAVRAGRSGGGRRPHVGARLDGVSLPLFGIGVRLLFGRGHASGVRGQRPDIRGHMPEVGGQGRSRDGSHCPW